MQLPKDFIDKYTYLLGEEAEAFFATYNQPKASGLRVNPLKGSTDTFLAKQPFQLQPVPFCETGFYYEEAEQPGKHPLHAAGAYYIQEPSAMFVGEVLSPEPGDIVLDLCAAPGGKSTHLAGRLQGDGLLLANEIHPVRVKALAENVERLGVRNCIVTNETPAKLAARLSGFFDKILVDAPCSGEGMFRKDPDAISYWSLEHVENCAKQQREILHHAYAMLKEGGTLVYSTCTFAPEENEQIIEWLLAEYPDMELIPIAKEHGLAPGRTEWSRKETDMTSAVRLWPQLLKGEGHFVAKLRKHGPSSSKVKPVASTVTKQQFKEYEAFAKQTLSKPAAGILFTFGMQLYAVPESSPSFDKLKVIRAGLHLGEFKKNRFEPNHALALALQPDDVQHVISLESEQEEWKAYMRGETLQTGGSHGWSVVTIDGYTLGWGKETQGILKNAYPKGLRRHI